MHRQLRVFVYMSGLLSTTHALQTAFDIPHTLLLPTYEFPDYIATEKNPTDHKLIYWDQIWSGSP